MNRPDPEPASFRSILGLASVAFALFLTIAGFRVYHELSRARQQEADLERQIELTDREIDRLERRVERLRSDPVLLERLAREELGLVRPGEVVILVERPNPLRPKTSPRPGEPPSSGPPAPGSP